VGDDGRQVVKVVTRESKTDVVARGYTGDWRADGQKLAQCRYVICVRNRRPSSTEAKRHMDSL
jgi:hypothetical protein